MKKQRENGMQRLEILGNIKNTGVVAVVRGKNKDIATKSAEACIDGGVKGIELTFTVPGASDVIEALTDKYNNDSEVCIGAGTVLDPTTARLAIMAGAKFVVSPSFNKDVAKLCNLYQIPYIPGCETITEVQTALTYGSDIVKIFPGNVVGQDFISAIKAPMPQVSVMPTGGVSLDNMEEWFNKGVTVVGAGSNLVGPADEGDFEAVRRNAEAYHQQFMRISLK